MLPWDLSVYGTGTDLYHIIQWFFIYSILGWVVESVYMSICERRLVNRGFIFGPICPIYGFGALGAYFLLKPFAGNYVLLYVLGSILATTFEYLVGRLMIHIFGQVWWDYTEKPYQYQGIICLESSLAWGLYTVILFAFLQKGVMLLTDLYSYPAGCMAGGFLMAYYLVDFTIHLCRAKFPGIPERARELRRNVLRRDRS